LKNDEHRDKLVVIMPAYNEEESIGFTIEGVRKYTDADIVVVNDGSSDATARVSRSSGARVLDHPFNLGYGAALQTGFMYALSKEYDYAVQIDADGQHDPSSIQVLLEPVMKGESDVAIGTRFDGGRYSAPAVRRAGMFFFAALTSLLTGTKVSDSTSGYQALNRRIMEFYASDSYPADYPDADVIIMLNRKGFRFREVPVTMHAAKNSKSMHGGFRPLFYMFKMALSILVTLLRREESI
jgi:glycosyltransferase involved in cell wall biosynthesis